MLLTGRIPALPPFRSLRPDLPACTVGISPEGHDERPGTHPSRLVHAARILRFKLECEQELWAECSRLIANCIIFYNASLLSRLLEHQESIGDTRGAEATKKVCPVAWQHINLQGRFEFLKIPDILNVDAIIQRLTSPHAGRVVNLFP
jgi:hypothetical protein